MDILNQFLKNYRDNGDNFDTLKTFIESNDFTNALTILLNDEKELEEICKKSTIHSNQFLKIVLASDAGYKLRLHIWQVKEENQYHEPHNHRWDFKSYILTGRIINQIIIEENTLNNTFLKCKAEGMNIGNNRGYQIEYKTGIKKIKEERYKKGNMYEMEADTIHIAKIPKNTFTSTLFITSPAKKDFSEVYMPDLKLPPSEKILKPVDVNTLKINIKKIIGEI